MRKLLLLAVPAFLMAQDPKHYDCVRAVKPPNIDGKLDDRAWRDAPWSTSFVDIEGDAKPAPRFRTRMKMLWDNDYLYIGAELEEPHVWATLTEHDSVIFHDNDFEVFLDPDGDTLNYYELEINALGTTWDLLLNKPYRVGGKADNSWEMVGLKSAVAIAGTLNKSADTDQGWTVELALPWKALAQYSKQPLPPRNGDEMRLNFSRVEWQTEIVDGHYSKLPGLKEANWVWSPQGAINMHIPERWGSVRFMKKSQGAPAPR